MQHPAHLVKLKPNLPATGLIDDHEIVAYALHQLRRTDSGHDALTT
jgi:hypothetical protein